MEFTNVYQDISRADSYSKLEFPGTYYLAYRDIPEIIKKHVNGKMALDFGCGAGRSARFLKKLGFNVKGLDISQEMLDKALQIEPDGDYQLIREGWLNGIGSQHYDLVFSAFTFDNVPNSETKRNLFREFKRVLKPGGVVINLVSSPELYKNEWASFSTRVFPGNFTAKCGDKVYTIMLDVDDKRPVEDILWPDKYYRQIYRQAGLELIEIHKPLGKTCEHYSWVNETRISPWAIYVLSKTGDK
jgi:ubiquinone/menaquinone biosynthesis C-methylase UbiE